MRAQQQAIAGVIVAALAALILVAGCVRSESQDRGPHLFHLRHLVSR